MFDIDMSSDDTPFNIMNFACVLSVDFAKI